MVIYGVALLAVCMLAGMVLGDLLGVLVGVEANVGGVGIAMILLLAISSWKKVRMPFAGPTSDGIAFWSAMYIPIVVAMAAKQIVAAAVSGGWLALVAGAGAVLASFALVPVLSRLAHRK